MLITLDVEHEAALRALVADFRAADEEQTIALYFGLDWPIEQVVHQVAAWARGDALAEHVPRSVRFWQEEGQLLGVLSLRHHLTERLRQLGGHIGYAVRPSARRRGVATRMLAAGLIEARARGIERVLVTCDPANVGSALTIERNGGVVEDEIEHPSLGRRVRRYWIGPSPDAP